MPQSGMTPPRFGLNFSHRIAGRLGLPAEQVFLALLIHLRPALLRLSLYWDEIGIEPGRYDFAPIQWYLDRAEEHGCRVVLTAGFLPQRQLSPLLPHWLSSEENVSGRLLANRLLMLERGVALLADYNTIEAWQIEGASRVGPQGAIEASEHGAPLLDREVEVIRDVDPRARPVVISYAGARFQSGRMWRTLTAGEIAGMNLPAQPRGALTRRLIAAQLHLLTAIAKRAGRQFWITELPAEWEHGTAMRGQSRGSGASGIDQAVHFARQTGAARVYFTGCEQWYHVREQGDDRAWQRARALLRPSPDQGI